MSRPRAAGERPVHWVGSAKRDLLAMPAEVVDDFGFALGLIQLGGVPPSAKPWKGEGPGVLELVEEHGSGTYRTVVLVRFRRAVYVLHCFQKKSTRGIRTAARDVALVRERLRVARQDHEVRHGTS